MPLPGCPASAAPDRYANHFIGRDFGYWSAGVGAVSISSHNAIWCADVLPVDRRSGWRPAFAARVSGDWSEEKAAFRAGRKSSSTVTNRGLKAG